LKVEQVECDQAGEQLVGGLAAVSESTGELGRRRAGPVEVGEDQGLGRGEGRPARGLEAFEQLAVEPPAGAEQQRRERHRWHGRHLSAAAPLSSGVLTTWGRG
jgi:hypothetical protein